MESILNSIKKFVGVGPDDTSFDEEIILDINSVFFVLQQLGIGLNTTTPFTIEDDSAEWSDFVEDRLYEACKTYMGFKVKMAFDPPASSFLADTINKQIAEYETRLTYAVDEHHNYYKDE